MHRILAIICSVFVLSALAPGRVSAKTAFDPEFTVSKIVGSVSIKLADAKKFADAEAGKAYPYGTTVRTDRKASAVLTFSEGNVCRIAAKTTVVISEDTKNQLLKVMNLAEGKLDMEMDQMVEGQQLHIETAAAVCGITGTKLAIESTRERNVNATIIAVREVGSSVAAWSEFFKIPDITEDRELVISMTDKRDYIRIRIIRGKMTIQLQDDSGAKDIGVDTGSLVKIFVREYDDYVQVTGLVYETDQPGAALVGTVSIRKEKKKETPPPPPTEDKGDTTTPPPEPGKDDANAPKPPDDRDQPVVVPLTTTTSTIPDTTPKGRR